MNETRATGRNATLTLTALCALACSNSVDLSTQPYLSASSDPTVIGIINEQVDALVVDDQRLYWIGTRGNPSEYGSSSALRSCNRQSCASSLITYAESGVTRAGGLGVVSGKVYWFGPIGTQVGNPVLLECDASGCIGAPQQISKELISPINSTAFGPDATYICSDGLARISLALGSSEPTLQGTDQPCSAVAVGNGYVYWLEQSTQTNTSKLMRGPADFKGESELLANDLESTSYNFGSLALDDRYVYWGQGGLVGSVARCPLAGCTGAPEVVASPIRAPATLLVDGKTLYWQHDTATQGEAISRCSLGACTPTEPLIDFLEGVSTLAVDEQYLYTATADPAPQPGVLWTNEVANIRRITK